MGDSGAPEAPAARPDASVDTVAVVAAVIRRGESLLLGRRPVGKRHGGLWEFPGGKVLPDEDFESAARRELREELDLTLDALGPELHRITDPGSPFRIHFHVAIVTGTPRALEHSEVRWCDAAEIARLGLAPADAEFVRARLGTGTAAGNGEPPTRDLDEVRRGD